MNLYYARLSKFIKHVLYERLSKLRCKNIVIYKKMNFVSLWLHTKFAHRSISSIIRIESRIHKSFDRIPFVRSKIRMKIKKELTGRIRRGQTRGVTEREKKTGEIWPTGWREQGEKQFDSHNIQPAHWWSMQSCPNSRYIVLACWPDLAKYIALSGRGQLRL